MHVENRPAAPDDVQETEVAGEEPLDGGLIRGIYHHSATAPASGHLEPQVQ